MQRTASNHGLLLGYGLLAATLLCFGDCTPQPDPSAIEVNLRRDEVVARFGEPLKRTTLHKTDDPVWGAIETFWDDVPMGSTVEIWHYQAPDGTVELYFVDGSAVVNGVGFAPADAVYEAAPPHHP